MRKSVLLFSLLVATFLLTGNAFAQDRGRGRERRPPQFHERAVPREQPRAQPPPQYRHEYRGGHNNFWLDWGYPRYRGYPGYYPYYRYYPYYGYYQRPQVYYVPGEWVWDEYWNNYVWVPGHYERVW